MEDSDRPWALAFDSQVKEVNDAVLNANVDSVSAACSRTTNGAAMTEIKHEFESRIVGIPLALIRPISPMHSRVLATSSKSGVNLTRIDCLF